MKVIVKGADVATKVVSNSPKLVDAIPVVSQVKSLVQLARGESDKSLKTQETFTKSTPVVSSLWVLSSLSVGTK